MGHSFAFARQSGAYGSDWRTRLNVASIVNVNEKRACLDQHQLPRGAFSCQISATSGHCRHTPASETQGNALTRDEHLAWCKRRALEYVDAGDLTHAVASMRAGAGDPTCGLPWNGCRIITLCGGRELEIDSEATQRPPGRPFRPRNGATNAVMHKTELSLDNQFSFAGQLLAEDFRARGFSRIGKPCGQFFDLATGDADGLSYAGPDGRHVRCSSRNGKGE